MSPNPYGISRLPYPINRRTLLEQDDLFPFVSGNPEDSDDCSWFVIQLSNENRLKFTSALLAGMDLIYPDEFVSLMQLWLQPTEFPNTFPPVSIGCEPVDLCALILECIQTTPELQQAIAFYSNSSAIEQLTPENETILDTDLFGGQSGCDNDKIFGACRQLANFLNVTSEDILELFVTAAATPGRLGDLIEAMPGIGILPFDDILQFIEKMAEQVSDAYSGAYDTQMNEDIACLFFCASQDDCVLTLETARNAIKSKLIESVSDTDFLTVVSDIVLNNWLGEQGVYVMHWLILDTIIFGGEILGQDVKRMVATVASYFNDPDPDWETLCTACVTIYYLEIDLTSTAGNVTPNAGQAFYSAGTGYTQVNASGVSRVYVDIILSNDYRFISTDFTFTKNPATGNGLRQIIWLDDTTEKDSRLVTGGEAFPDPAQFLLFGDENPVNKVRCNINSSGGLSSIIMTKIRVTIETDIGIDEFTSNGWTEYIP